MTRRAAGKRTGTSLVELLTALPLMAIATACATMLLVQAAADRRAQAIAHTGARELRQARALLAAEVAPLRARELLVVSDTLLAVLSQLGVATVCAYDSTSVDMAPPIGAASVAWLDGMRAGDGAALFTTGDVIGAAPQGLTVPLRGAARRVGAGRCGATDVPQRWRVSVGGLLGSSPLLIGAPIAIQREVQFVHYRSNGRWWLGRRARDGVGWEVTQPVAGPLESPARGGVTLRGLTRGRMSTSVIDSIAALALTLRASPPVSRLAARVGAPRRVVLPADSLVSELPLRAASWSRGAP